MSRRICPRDWQKDILIVRKNINNAIQDMPAVDEIAQMLAGTCMYIFVFVVLFYCSIVSVLIQ